MPGSISLVKLRRAPTRNLRPSRIFGGVGKGSTTDAAMIKLPSSSVVLRGRAKCGGRAGSLPVLEAISSSEKPAHCMLMILNLSPSSTRITADKRAQLLWISLAIPWRIASHYYTTQDRPHWSAFLRCFVCYSLVSFVSL